MHPVLFQIGPFSAGSFHAGPLTVYSYGVMLAAAAVICTVLLARDAAKAGFSADKIYDFMFTVILGGLLGARAFYILIAWPEFAGNLWEIVRIDHGGVAWQGGFLGGTLAGIWFVRRQKWLLRPFMDLCAPYIALGQAVGRIGCFLNGCCYGKECGSGFCLYFPSLHARLIPTQLYEAGSLFVIYVLLKIAQGRPQKAGMVFVLYLWLAAIERFVIEFFRADQAIVWQGLSPFQYIALGVFIAGIVVFLRFRK